MSATAASVKAIRLSNELHIRMGYRPDEALRRMRRARVAGFTDKDFRSTSYACNICSHVGMREF